MRELPKLLASTGGESSAHRPAAIALRGVRYEARIEAMHIRTTVRQSFVNQEACAVEAVYTFPMPAESAVCGFRMEVGGRLIEGKAEARAEAEEMYDASISRGDGAFLLEQERPDIFTLNVGNILPGQSMTAEISSVEPLEFDGRRLRISLPTTIASRYVTSSGMKDLVETAMDGDRINPPRLLSVPYGLTLALDVAPGRTPGKIASPTHKLSVSTTPDGGSHVAFASPSEPMDRDVVIEMEFPADAEPVAVASSGPPPLPGEPEDRFLSVSFIPELEPEDGVARAPQEVIFLVDCSGSMAGESIAEARRALDLCLRSMACGDLFNICRFGSSIDPFKRSSVSYSEGTLADALEYVRRMDADLGGTELLPALEAILPSRSSAKGIRNVIVLTDGEVGNEPEVIEFAAKHAATNRIFTFGIGASPSQSLVKGLARRTSGKAEFVAEGEEIAEKVLRLFSRIESPAVSDVQIDWGAGHVEQAPELLPPLFDGDVLSAFCRIDASLVPEQVRLTCKVDGQSKEWSVPVRTTPDTSPSIFWARSRLKELEERAGRPELARKSSSASAERRQEREMVSLSKRFNILCGRTAFVAIEERPASERNNGEPEYRRIPVQLAHGWHGVEVDAMLREPSMCASPPPSYAPPCPRTLKNKCAQPMLPPCELGLDASYSGRPNKPKDKVAHEPRMECSDDYNGKPLFAVLETQKANGRFEWRPEFDAFVDDGAVAVADKRREMTLRLSGILHGKKGAHWEDIIATLLAVWFMETHCQKDNMYWDRAARKARRWLRSAGVEKPEDIWM